MAKIGSLIGAVQSPATTQASQTIDDYKNAWAKASASGDKSGMDAAHAAAEALRAQQGYSGGTDGAQYIPLSGAGQAPAQQAPAQHQATGTYVDRGLSADDKARVEDLQHRWQAGKAAGASQEELDALHAQAEAIRNPYGYSGGADGSEFNAFEVEGPVKAGMRGPTSQSAYLDSLYAAQREAALAALKAAYEQNVIDIDAQGAKIPALYQGARNRTAATAQQEKAGFNEYAAAQGLNSGAGGQAALSMANQNAANMSAINQQEAGAINDLETTRLKISTGYQNDIAQAIAQGDIARAQALYQEAVRVDNGLVQQSMAQADENYRYWAANNTIGQQTYEQKVMMAETLAQYGNFSGYAALGYTPEHIDNMQRSWNIMNPQISGYGAYSGGGGYSGGSGGGGGGAPPPVNIPEGLERMVGMNRTKAGQQNEIERLYKSAKITEAQANELYRRMGI